MFVKDGPRGAVFDVIVPLHWIVIDMVPDAWRLVFAGIGDAVARLRCRSGLGLSRAARSKRLARGGGAGT